MAKQQKSLLSANDLDSFRKIVRQEVSEEIAIQLEEKLNEKLGYLPTKDEFYEKMDQILGEVQAMREDFAAHKSTHEDLDKDIPNLEHKVKHLYKIFEVEEPADVIPSY
jgi:hypothetical protein